MGKSKHRKWFEKDDYDQDYQQANRFKERRQKRLRTIVNKHEFENDLDDGEDRTNPNA